MPRGQTFRDVHVDRSLSNLSIAHWQTTDMFVSGRFFSNLPVINASDTYTTYPQGYFNRIYDSKRAEDGIANSIQYKTVEETYSVKEDALRIFISDKKRANADPHRNLDMEATEAVTNAIMIGKEQDFSDTFLTTGKWSKDITGWDSTGIAGANQRLAWDLASADPVQDVLDEIVEMVKRGGGRRPNKGLMTLDLYMKVREHPSILDRVRYNQGNAAPAQITTQALAMLFELDEIMLMQTVINMADDGIEDSTTGLPPVNNQFISSEAFLMCHVPPGAGLYTATASLTFAWNQYIAHGLNAGPAIRRYRPQDGRKGEFIEAELAIDQKIVSKDLGTLFTGMIGGAAGTG